MKPKKFTVHFHNKESNRKEFWEVCVYHSPVTNVVELSMQHNSGDSLDMPLCVLMDIAHKSNLLAQATFTSSHEESQSHE